MHEAWGRKRVGFSHRRPFLSQLHPPTENKAMVRKQNPTESGTSRESSDQRRCEQIRHLPNGQLFDDLETPSKEAEGHRWLEDVPICCDKFI